MLLRIFIEALIAAALLFVGYSFWQLIKRDRYMKQVLATQSFLDTFITQELFINPPARVDMYAQKNSIGWFINIQTLLKSDGLTQRKMETTYLALVVFLLMGSYLLGVTFLIINLVLFLLVSYLRLSDPARVNALENLHCLALILHRWITENRPDCERWIQQTDSLRKIYLAVEKLSNGSL